MLEMNIHDNNTYRFPLNAEPFDRQVQHLLGNPLPAHGTWRADLWSVMKGAIEMTAIQRRVDR